MLPHCVAWTALTRVGSAGTCAKVDSGLARARRHAGSASRNGGGHYGSVIDDMLGKVHGEPESATPRERQELEELLRYVGWGRRSPASQRSHRPALSRTLEEQRMVETWKVDARAFHAEAESQVRPRLPPSLASATRRRATPLRAQILASRELRRAEQDKGEEGRPEESATVQEVRFRRAHTRLRRLCSPLCRRTRGPGYVPQTVDSITASLRADVRALLRCVRDRRLSAHEPATVHVSDPLVARVAEEAAQEMWGRAASRDLASTGQGSTIDAAPPPRDSSPGQGSWERWYREAEGTLERIDPSLGRRQRASVADVAEVRIQQGCRSNTR